MKYALVLGLTGLVAVNAHPQPRAAENQDGADLSKRAVDVSEYTIPGLASYTTAADAGEASFSIASSGDYVEAATQLVKEVAPDAEFRVVEDHYVGTNGIAHVNFKQTVHGLDVDNGDFSVNVRKDGSIFSHGNSFFTGKLPAESPLTKRDYADPVAALKDVIEVLGLPVEAGDDTAAETSLTGDDDTVTLTGTTGAVSDPKARLVYLYDGEDLKLTWRVETDVEDNWLLTYVDASSTTEVLGVVDYVSDLATYQVYPWGVNDPTEGSRTVKTDPWLLSASPFTWIGDGTTNYTTTRGNNAIAQVNPSGGTSYLNNFRPDSPQRKFEYPYSLTETNVQAYWNASITQLFYSSNQLHDLLYVLGFNEPAGNFQTNNNGKGGAGNDFVILNAQDGSGTNNANFATPPDGQNGRMRMYLWTYSNPQRDCSFESGVVIHEYIHGLSNRLTGGPANSGCLPSGEPGGMGEGWSDFYATAIRLKPADTRSKNYPMGAWVRNSAAGIRAYPYSTSLTTNPLTYRNIDSVSGVHAIGTIWATILYEVLWNLIDAHGKNDADFPTFDSNGVPTDGKYLALKLVQDGMALQPCRPDFIAARDAIIDADEALTGGDNVCRLWQAFAKRGLGPNARRSPRTEDFTIPSGCLS